MNDRNFKEPYFIPANDPQFLKNESWIENNQRFRQGQKFDFYRNAMDFIVENDVSGSYFEFGVHRARTFTMVMSLDDFYASNKGATGGSLTQNREEDISINILHSTRLKAYLKARKLKLIRNKSQVRLQHRRRSFFNS